MAFNLFELFGVISIKTADAHQAIDDTLEKAKGLGEALGGIGESADGASKKMQTGSKFDTGAVWLGNTLSTLSEKAAKLVLDLGKIGFGFNTSMESYQYQFEALLGDAEKASQLVADLQELAKISPLGMEGLAQNAVTLLTTGTELADILPTLEMLGNLSLGDAGRMQSVVKAYTQILGKGGLMAQEMYQLGDAMVPIVEIMTKYGGERYADGSWYQQKMADPSFKIPAEDMVKAFQAATAEGGKWHDYMLIIMDSFAGQADRLGEEGKETIGAFFAPFFDLAKSDVLPRLTESLGLFRTWVDENQESITAFAESIGNLAVDTFDGVLQFFQWLTENGDAVGTALSVIAIGLAAGAIAAHPYAAAIMAVAAGLAYLNSEEGQRRQRYDHFFDDYSDEDLQILQAYVDAVNEARKVEEAYFNSGFDESIGLQWDDALAKQQQAHDAAKAIDGLIATYNAWRSGQAENQGKDLYLDVPLRVEEGAESAIQSELGGMSLEAVVQLLPDASRLSGLSKMAAGDFSNIKWNADGAIFSKPTIFNTPLGLQGVGEAGAEAVAPIDKLQQYVSDAVKSTVGGMQFNIVLDSGALVGQLAPGLDRQLGSIASRKGRG